MVSLEDCIAFCGLNEDEVAAISEHEHIPEIAATALADYLLKQPHGGELAAEASFRHEHFYKVREIIFDGLGVLAVSVVGHCDPDASITLRHY